MFFVFTSLMGSSKEFTSIKLDLSQARKELEAFGKFLNEHQELDEQKEILPFFRSHQQLSGLIGLLDPNISTIDSIAFEYDIFGDFRSDLVIGDSEQNTYLFVEFEDAKEKSIFKKLKKKYMAEWSPRFEHGYSQLIDWFWRLDGARSSDLFLERFGRNQAFRFEGMLIIGRDQFVSERDRMRLQWRTDRVTVDSKHIRGYTYDELFNMLSRRLNRYYHYPQ